MAEEKLEEMMSKFFQQMKEEKEERRVEKENQRKKEKEEEEERRRREEEMKQEQLNQIMIRFEESIFTQQKEINEDIEKVREEIEEFNSKVELAKEEMVKKIEAVKDEMETVKGEIMETVKKEMDKRIRTQRRNSGNVAATVKMQPPTYDGQIPWLVYQKQFEAASETNGWDSEEKARALIIALRGQALDLLQTIPKECQNDYNELAKNLELRFGNSHMQLVFQTQLRSRFQKAGETLQEFEADVRRMVQLAFPEAPDSVQEQLAVQAFIEGIRDTEVKKTLRLSGCRKSSEVLITGAYKGIGSGNRLPGR